MHYGNRKIITQWVVILWEAICENYRYVVKTTIQISLKHVSIRIHKKGWRCEGTTVTVVSIGSTAPVINLILVFSMGLGSIVSIIVVHKYHVYPSAN